MELNTVPALTPIMARFLKIDDTNHAVPAFFAFLVGGAGNEESKIIANAINRLNGCSYLMREYADSAHSPFADNVQSVVNLVGSFRESLEGDVRLRIWNDLTALGLNPAFEVICKDVTFDGGVIPVAYNGEIFTLKPVFTYGPNHRDNCDTCQAGNSLLQHSLSELRSKVCYNLDSLKNGNFHFGENPILNTDGMIPVDCERDMDGNRIREFVNWFIATNEGPLTMADIELTFEIGN